MKIISAVRIPLLCSVVLLGVSRLGSAQQVPKSDKTGSPVCVVRNESTAATAFEYRKDNQWKEVKLDPSGEAKLSADRIRIATTREDNAIVTVDLPVQAGKKYRIIWNTQTAIWDFSPAP